MMHALRCLTVFLLCLAPALAAEPGDAKEPITIVTLGDSITRGVRGGVTAEQTFAFLLERDLKAKGVNAKVVNVGRGGEETVGALNRLEEIISLQPRFVTVMYGTNDSYIYPGKTASKLTVAEYRANLEQIVTKLREKGIEPILMTEPRWAETKVPTSDSGQHPNVTLSEFMQECRAVAREKAVPLIDHFAQWSDAVAGGRDLWDWTTDGCHLNPAGHEVLTAAILPVLIQEIKPPLPQTLAKLKAGETVRVVCFGDSVTGVYYHTGGRRAYTDMLGIALGRAVPGAKVEMVNAGISGHTTENALARIEKDVLAHKPTLVTVMFGLNDMTRIPLETYKANLQKIIAQCRGVGAEVLLCTPNNVISSSGRPSEKLLEYCAAIYEVGQSEGAPVADSHEAMEVLRKRDALSWRLLLSDAIHPNMDGHKRMAETLAKAITGRTVALDDVAPPQPVLIRTPVLLKEKKPIKVLAMPPYDAQIAEALKAIDPEAVVEVTPWPVADQTLAQIEQYAKDHARAFKPDLVVVAVPRTAATPSQEAEINSYTWIMNWALSFGLQEWDVLVVHPAVTEPLPGDAAAELVARDALIRRLVAAQDLWLLDRKPDDTRPAAEVFREGVKAAFPAAP